MEWHWGELCGWWFIFTVMVNCLWCREGRMDGLPCKRLRLPTPSPASPQPQSQRQGPQENQGSTPLPITPPSPLLDPSTWEKQGPGTRFWRVREGRNGFEMWCSWIIFPGDSVVKNPLANAEVLGSVPGVGRSPGEGHGNPLQYPYLENPMDRGAWWATAHGVAKSWTQLSTMAWWGLCRSTARVQVLWLMPALCLRGAHSSYLRLGFLICKLWKIQSTSWSCQELNG